MDDHEVQLVLKTCERLDRVIHRYIGKLALNNTKSVSTSIVTNMATTMLANALVMAESAGQDIDPIMDAVLHATHHKYEVIRSQIEAQAVLTNIINSAKGKAH